MNEFDLFIQELLGNTNPKGNMFTGQFVKDQREDDYYKNPFRMQDSIDEAMRKKLAEEAAAKAAGMLQTEQTQSGSGESSYEPTSSASGYNPNAVDMNTDYAGLALMGAGRGAISPQVALVSPVMGAMLGAGGMLSDYGWNQFNAQQDANAKAMANAQNYGYNTFSNSAGNVQTVATPESVAQQTAREFNIPIEEARAIVSPPSSSSDSYSGGGSFSGYGGVDGSGVSAGGGNAAGGYGYGGW